MSRPANQLIIVDKTGEQVDLKIFFENLIPIDERILVRDEMGISVYVGDLGFYRVVPTGPFDKVLGKIEEIHSSRLPKSTIRIQVGSVVESVTGDTVFTIKEGNHLIKKRADKLENGMILSDGREVFLWNIKMN